MLLKRSKAGQMTLVLVDSDNHTINLTCEIETECIRWCFYLKVLLVWFHKTGSHLLANMQANLDDADRIFYSKMTSFSQYYQSSEGIHLISDMAQQSFISFINEHSDIGSLLPMHIDVNCTPFFSLSHRTQTNSDPTPFLR